MASNQEKRGELLGTKIGTVTSDKSAKTRIVEVQHKVKHPKYGKWLKRDTRYHVHDEDNASKIGDRVEIANCRPYSKTKSWRLVKVIEAAPVVETPQTVEPTVETAD